MRAMKDSGIDWIGEIPQGWNLCRIKTLFEIIGGNGFKEHLQGNESGDYPFYKVSDINGDSTHSGRAANYITSLTAKEYAFNLVPSKSIIMSKIGEALKKNHRKISSTDCFIDNNLQALVPIADIDEVFYYYVLCCINMEWFDNGGTIPSVNNQKLRDFKIPLPTKNQQISIGQRIQKKCAEIDALIAAKEKTNALLKERRQSIIYEAVTKGLDPTAPMKDSGVEWIGKIPEGWSVGKTIYALSMPITDGPHETPELLNDGIPFVSAEAVSSGNGRIDFDHIRGFISKEYYEECSKKYKPQINDIYMIKSGATTGKVALVDTDRIFTIWSPLAVFRADDERCNYRYLFYFLQSDAYQKQVETKWTYGTQQNIGMRSLEKLLMCFPPVDEQVAIADHLDKSCDHIGELIRINDAAIQQLKEYRQSLIYEAVTGKIEV